MGGGVGGGGGGGGRPGCISSGPAVCHQITLCAESQACNKLYRLPAFLPGGIYWSSIGESHTAQQFHCMEETEIRVQQD